MRQGSIFEKSREKSEPLATRVRPETLDDFVGQTHLLGKGKLLREIIENDRVNDFLGTARSRQDNIGPYHRKSNKI